MSVPEGWQEVRLGRVSSVNPRPSQKPRQDATVGFVPMTAVSEEGGFGWWPRIYEEVAKGYTYFVDGDVLVAKITPCFENGKGAYAEGLPGGKGFGSTEFHVLRSGRDLDERYLYYLTRTGQFRARGAANMQGSAGQRRVPTDFLRSYRIPLPPLPEQRRIAEILGTWDEAIALVERRIAAARRRKQGLMQRLLTGQVRFPGFAGAWREVRLGEVTTKVGSGLTPRGGRDVYLDAGISLLRSQNVLIGSLSLADVAYISNEQHQIMSGTIVRPYDVLLNITGASIGRCCMVPPSLEEANVNQHVCIIRADTTRLEPAFLESLLISDIGQRQVLASQAGGNRQGLNFQQIRRFRLSLPSSAEQRAISEAIRQGTCEIDLLTRKLAALQGQKKGLMQRLLTGWVRVKV